MADISMCLNKTCNRAARCKRSELSGTTFSEHKQSITLFSKLESGDDCSSFWEVRKNAND